MIISGALLKNATNIVPKAEDKTVAIISGWTSTFESLNILALTISMYTEAKYDVKAAKVSLLKLTLCSFNLKNFSILST